MSIVTLGARTIGMDLPPYVIAEIGSNHNGDMRLCRQLIDAAADAGADAVKFQSWSEQSLISKAEFEANTEYADKKKHFGSLRAMVRKYQLTPDQHREVASYCATKQITFCSTPFSPEEVDLLVELEVPFIKTASMDINNIPLLRYIARKQLPVIVSTGMATIGEIEAAVRALRDEGNSSIVLLHCVSLYPPDPSTINLRNIRTLSDAFGVPVGFSDHTVGTHIPMAAVALGACIVEKHFTLNKSLEGWDHAISADVEELRQIVSGVTEVSAALGSAQRVVSEAEIAKRGKFRRSAVAARTLPAGHRLAQSDVVFKRPGTGVAPDQLESLIGRRLAHAVGKDELIKWDSLLV